MATARQIRSSGDDRDAEADTPAPVLRGTHTGGNSYNYWAFVAVFMMFLLIGETAVLMSKNSAADANERRSSRDPITTVSIEEPELPRRALVTESPPPVASPSESHVQQQLKSIMRPDDDMDESTRDRWYDEPSARLRGGRDRNNDVSDEAHRHSDMKSYAQDRFGERDSRISGSLKGAEEYRYGGEDDYDDSDDSDELSSRNDMRGESQMDNDSSLDSDRDDFEGLDKEERDLLLEEMREDDDREEDEDRDSDEWRDSRDGQWRAGGGNPFDTGMTDDADGYDWVNDPYSSGESTFYDSMKGLDMETRKEVEAMWHNYQEHRPSAGQDAIDSNADIDSDIDSENGFSEVDIRPSGIDEKEGTAIRDAVKGIMRDNGADLPSRPPTTDTPASTAPKIKSIRSKDGSTKLDTSSLIASVMNDGDA